MSGGNLRQAMHRLDCCSENSKCLFSRRLVSVPDRHFSRNIIYQDQHHSTSANKVKTSTVSIGKRTRRKEIHQQLGDISLIFKTLATSAVNRYPGLHFALKKRYMAQTIHPEHACHVCEPNTALSWDFLFGLYENSPFYLLKFFYLNNIYYSICSKSKKKLI